ncbi:MAG: permease [Acidobacteriota bacterium]
MNPPQAVAAGKSRRTKNFLPEVWLISQRGKAAWARLEFWRSQWKPVLLTAGIFVLFWHLPLESPRFQGALTESLHLARWYAREHVLFCLVPAFFIAGALGVFLSGQSVMKYLGADAPKPVAYAVGSVSGTLLAVCSCTVLPLFAGIYRMGAGLGPAVAFLYSGPAINALAIILTARVLGWELGLARAVGAVAFSVVIGLLMHLIFRREPATQPRVTPFHPAESRPLHQTALFLASLVAVLVFATWAEPVEPGLWAAIHSVKWLLTGASALAMAAMLVAWMKVRAAKVLAGILPVFVLAVLYPHQPIWAFVTGILALSLITSTEAGEAGEWFRQSWSFARQILPLLLLGVLVAGALLGRPGYEGLIPSGWVSAWVGGNSLLANFAAALAGAFMYFATLTEIPILQGLIGSGMGQGPALALLLAGPALSLPNMLVIRGVMGTRKTVAYVALVVVMATMSGVLWGWFAG